MTAQTVSSTPVNPSGEAISDSVKYMDWEVIWCFFCLSIAAFFTLATLIVYNVVPKLNNLQGSVRRHYLVSYLGHCSATLLFFSLYHRLQAEPGVTENICDCLRRYVCTASAFWLNMMSFDIWRKFRKMRSSQQVNQRVSDEAVLVRYSIYAWGIPAVSPIFDECLEFTSESFKNDCRYYLKFVDTLVLILVATCNATFYILTALTMKKTKNETTQVVNGVNRHYQENEQWFNLYVRLFTIMGVRTIFWIALPLNKSPQYSMCFTTLELLDGICVFLIFVWKEDVRRAFKKQFNETMCQLGAFFGRHTTRTLESADTIS